jgi:hypothetical protein
VSSTQPVRGAQVEAIENVTGTKHAETASKGATFGPDAGVEGERSYRRQEEQVGEGLLTARTHGFHVR